MLTAQQKKARADRLERLAREAVKQYNDETATGGEPVFPDWTMDLLGLLDDYDRLALALAEKNLQPVDCIDFETGTATTTVVQRQPTETMKGAQ